jgi:hypothetical protein
MAFERALRHAHEIAVSVPYGQVVVMNAFAANHQDIVTVWVLNKSMEKPYATWRILGNGTFLGQGQCHADMYVVEVCGRGGHLIACRRKRLKTVHMFSLHGVCIGGFKGAADRQLKVVGNCLVVYDRHLFTVYCVVHSGSYAVANTAHAVANTAHAVAVFSCVYPGRPAGMSYHLSPWQPGQKFYVVATRFDFAFQFPTVVFEADLHRGTFEAYARSGAHIRVLQVLQDVPGDEDSLIVFDKDYYRVERMSRSGHLQQLLHNHRLIGHMYHRHHSTLGWCFARCGPGFCILFYPNEDGQDGRTCRALRMSRARKTWIQASAL